MSAIDRRALAVAAMQRLKMKGKIGTLKSGESLLSADAGQLTNRSF